MKESSAVPREIEAKLAHEQRHSVFDVSGRERRDLCLDSVDKSHTPAAGAQVAAELAHVIVRRLHDERRASLQRLIGVNDDVGIAQVLEVVGATRRVDEQVPILVRESRFDRVEGFNPTRGRLWARMRQGAAR